MPSSLLRLSCGLAAICLGCAPAHAQFGLGNLLQGVTGAAAAAAGAAAVQSATQPSAPAEAASGAATPVPPPPVYSQAELQAVLQAPVQAQEVPAGQLKSNLVLKGKRFHVAEYRVLFEVAGKVTANTRAAYFGGTNYGATRMSITYTVPQPDIALLQAVTDKAYADFLAQLQAAGLQPESSEAFVREHGAIYEATQEGTRAGAEVVEETDLGYGSRKYLVFAPTGTRLVPRGFAGLGAGNIGKRIDFTKGNLEALSVSVVVNLAAQESSGGGSSLFRRGSSANASAAMELAMAPRQLGVIQSHAHTQTVALSGAIPVPGQFANFREVGGYDSSKDAAVKALQVFGALTMGVAANNSKRVDLAIDVDQAALARQALQGLTGLNKAVATSIQ